MPHSPFTVYGAEGSVMCFAVTHVSDNAYIKCWFCVVGGVSYMHFGNHTILKCTQINFYFGDNCAVCLLLLSKAGLLRAGIVKGNFCSRKTRGKRGSKVSESECCAIASSKEVIGPRAALTEGLQQCHTTLKVIIVWFLWSHWQNLKAETFMWKVRKHKAYGDSEALLIRFNAILLKSQRFKKQRFIKISIG